MRKIYEERINCLYDEPNVRIQNPLADRFRNLFTVKDKFALRSQKIGSGAYCKVYAGSETKEYTALRQ